MKHSPTMNPLLILIPTVLLAQSGVTTPSIGFILDRTGGIRPVSGLAGNFLVQRSVLNGVLSFSCSSSTCVAKTENALAASGASFPAPSGPALISLDAAGAAVYFRQTGQFARLENGALKMLDVNVPGEVLAVGAGLRIAVRRENGVWIVGSSGSILDSLPPDTQAVLLGSDSIVYATANELALRRSGGIEQRFPASGIRDVYAVSDEWVEGCARFATFALRTAAGREALYVLPEPAGRPRR